MALNNALGEKLKALRKGKGVTIEQLCTDIKQRYHYPLSKGKYNEMERGVEKDFGYNAVICLAKYFGVSADYLIGIEKSTDLFELDGLIADINTAEIASHLNNMDEWTAKWRAEAEKALYKISEDCLK